MRIAALALVAGATLVLVGCVPAAPHPTAAPSVSATPLFASDEEALAAAEKAYAAYLAVSDQILADGGADPERLRPLVTPSAYSDELAGFDEFREKGWRGSGSTTYYNFTLESYEPFDASALVSAYVCSDLSATDVVDSSGNSVVAVSRPTKSALELQFALRKDKLVLATVGPWSGGGIC